MKTTNLIKLAVPVLLLMSGTALAQNIVGSLHDMTSGLQTKAFDNTGNSVQQQVCVYCHTPHKSIAGNGPLWNRTTNANTYTMYTSTTIDGAMAGTPGGESLACLSCHDGAIAIDSISNVPGSGTWTSNGLAIEGYALVGVTAGSITDLGNDHPIGVTYDPTADTGLVAITTAIDGTALELYGSNVVECATCHNVHDDTLNAFLRVTDNSSDICTTCHNK